MKEKRPLRKLPARTLPIRPKSCTFSTASSRLDHRIICRYRNDRVVREEMRRTQTAGEECSNGNYLARAWRRVAG